MVVTVVSGTVIQIIIIIQLYPGSRTTGVCSTCRCMCHSFYNIYYIVFTVLTDTVIYTCITLCMDVGEFPFISTLHCILVLGDIMAMFTDVISLTQCVTGVRLCGLRFYLL